MSTTFHLRVWTRFSDPVQRVWQVKTSPQAFALEFPPWAPFRPSDPDALHRALQTGEGLDTQARFGPGIAWPLRLDPPEIGRRFVDHSSNALFQDWRHEHIFEETAEGCRYIDALTFTPAVPAAKLSAVLTRHFFVHRHKAVAHLLNADSRTIGVSVLRVADLEELG